MKPKICIDPGHGGQDSGAVFQDRTEKDIVLELSLYLGALLSKHVNCLFTRTHDIYIPLSERVYFANENKVDIFVSIHTNADPDPDLPNMPVGSGEEIWIYKKPSEKTIKLAQTLKEYVDRIVPASFRGIKTGNLYVLHYTKMPAVLIEIGFIDNLYNRLNNWETLFMAAYHIHEGILKYFDIRR